MPDRGCCGRVLPPPPSRSADGTACPRASVVRSSPRSRHGFAPVRRGPGGRAVAYHRGCLCVDYAGPDEEPQLTIQERFAALTGLLAGALRSLGAARAGRSGSWRVLRGRLQHQRWRRRQAGGHRPAAGAGRVAVQRGHRGDRSGSVARRARRRLCRSRNRVGSGHRRREAIAPRLRVERCPAAVFDAVCCRRRRCPAAPTSPRSRCRSRWSRRPGTGGTGTGCRSERGPVGRGGRMSPSQPSPAPLH